VQSRRDHLQAYQFAVDRLVRAAVVGSRPGQADAPLRRSGLGVSIGIVLSVLLCAGALVFGLISPTPSETWRNPGTVIVDQSTGTNYLLLNGELRPTANYASARLVAGQSATVQVVASAQLKGIPVGPEIGIGGAPSDVPAAASLLPGTWALCTRQNGGVVLDLDPATSPGPTGQRIYVASADTADPAEYVVWDSTKYPLTEQTVLPAIGFGDQQPSPVDPAWLAALPTGPAVVAPTVPHDGETGPSVDGATAPVGTLYSTEAGSTEEDYILLADGLAPITRTEAALYAVAGHSAARQISTAAVGAAKASTDRSLLTALPDFLSGPIFGSSSEALCVRQTAPGAASGSQLVEEQAAKVDADPAVVVPANAGLLVEPPGQDPDAPNPIIYLVADNGQRYLLDSSNALSALGYAEAPKVVMPASVIGLIPAGPNLDVNAAAQAVTWQSG
jgi:type VII secretion protein EccB